MVNQDSYYKDHWVEIEQDRLDRYGQSFKITDANRAMFVDSLAADTGETIVDFGCGPGYVSIELAKEVGPDGLVHAVDLNADLLAMAKQNANDAGVADRIQFHQTTDETIPIPDGTVDRVIFKSVLLYVPDLGATLAEAYRVLRSGGTVVANDTDFWLSACPAYDREEWRRFLDAIGPAFADPTMGRNLPAGLKRCGLSDVTADVQARVDDRGTFRGTLENFFSYARSLGTMPGAEIDDMARRADEAIADGDWLFVINFFLCTGTKP